MEDNEIDYIDTTKVVLTFNIDANTARIYTGFCRKKGINRSYLLRKILKDFCRDIETNYKRYTDAN